MPRPMFSRVLRRVSATAIGCLLVLVANAKGETFGGLTAGKVAPTAAIPNSEFDCGPGCILQKGYQNALFQLQYTQEKSEQLRTAWEGGVGAGRRRVQDEIQGFCSDSDLVLTDQTTVQGGSGATICYRNAQLFNATMIQRYQESLKEIASNQTGITAGRNADGTVTAIPTVETGIQKSVQKVEVPTLSSVKTAFIQRILAQKNGVVQLTPKMINQAWSEALFIGGDPKAKLSFEGRAAKLNSVQLGVKDDGKKSGQVIDRDASGAVNEEAKLRANSMRVQKQSVEAMKVVAGSKAQGRSVDKATAEAMLTGHADADQDSIEYSAFLTTRNRLAGAFAGQIKKDEAKSKAASTSDVKDNSRKPSSATTNANGVAAAAGRAISNGSTADLVAPPVGANSWSKPTITSGKVDGSNYGSFAEEGQPEPTSEDATNYSVHHSGLDQELNQTALEEYEHSWATKPTP